MASLLVHDAVRRRPGAAVSFGLDGGGVWRGPGPPRLRTASPSSQRERKRRAGPSKGNTVELAKTLLAAGTSGSLSPRGRGLGVRKAGHDQSPCPKGRADWCDPSPYPLLQGERAK